MYITAYATNFTCYYLAHSPVTSVPSPTGLIFLCSSSTFNTPPCSFSFSIETASISENSVSLSSKNYVVHLQLIQEHNNEDHKDIWQDPHSRALSCDNLAMDYLLPLISGTSHCFLFRDKLVMRDSQHCDILVNYFIYLISTSFAAPQSFAALYYATIWLLYVHHNSFRASPKHLKPENCVFLPFFSTHGCWRIELV